MSVCVIVGCQTAAAEAADADAVAAAAGAIA